jgi:predicted O-methyltransferase YrrM
MQDQTAGAAPELSPAYRAAQSKRRDAEIDNAASLLRLREATIAHLESTVKMREAEIEAATELLRHREAAIGELQQRLGAVVGEASPGWSGLPLSDRIAGCLEAIDGWCTPAKAQWLARFIVERRAARVLEIGVFGGRSLIPMALAAQSLGEAGEVTGVEPWRAAVAVAEPTNAENDAWWSSVDFAAVKSRFFANAARLGVLPTIRILETDSQSALALFAASGASFDLIHVDGAHSPQRALDDAKSWSAFLKPRGLLVFDDIEWPSVQLARAWLKENLRVVDEVIEDKSSYGAYEKI